MKTLIFNKRWKNGKKKDGLRAKSNIWFKSRKERYTGRFKSKNTNKILINNKTILKKYRNHMVKSDFMLVNN